MPTRGFRRTGQAIFRLLGRSRIGKEGLDIGMQRRLIRVQRQHVVAFAVTNLRRNGGLTAHGIECDRTAAQVKQVKQLGDRRNLIRLVVHRNVPQHQAVFCSPGADEVQRGFPVGAVVTAAMGLPVNRNDIRSYRLDGLDPLQKALLKLIGVDAGKDAAKRIVGRNTVGKFQKRLQPGLFARAKLRNTNPIIRTTDYATNGDDHDIEQRMLLGSLDPWVVHGSNIRG